MVRFAKGQRKDDVAHEHLARFGEAEGIYMVGVAQEKTSTFRTEKRRNPETGARYPWIVAASALVNQYYLYGLDVDFGPFFLKFSSYFPYGAKLCFNGHHWAQRQAAGGGDRVHRAGQRVSGAAMTPTRCSASATGCRPRRSTRSFAAGWRGCRTRSPAADRRAGYRYELSILQAEFSLTQVLDRPHSGRVFFEQLIRENLDLGRPDKASLIFDRRVRAARTAPHPVAVAHPRAHPRGHPIDPRRLQALQDQAVPQAPDERSEPKPRSTTPGTSAIGKRLRNLPALRQVGFQANRRLLATQRLGHDPIAAARVLTTITDPVTVGDSRTRSPGCASATLARWRCSRCWPCSACPCGVSPTASCATHLAPLLGLLPGAMTAGQATYDLRRLRTHGLIERIPHTNRYLPTEDGLRAAIVLTQTHARLLTPALAAATDPTRRLPATYTEHSTTSRRLSTTTPSAKDSPPETRTQT